jgi:hypothetical protein
MSMVYGPETRPSKRGLIDHTAHILHDDYWTIWPAKPSMPLKEWSSFASLRTWICNDIAIETINDIVPRRLNNVSHIASHYATMVALVL